MFYFINNLWRIIFFIRFYFISKSFTCIKHTQKSLSESKVIYYNALDCLFIYYTTIIPTYTLPFSSHSSLYLLDKQHKYHAIPVPYYQKTDTPKNTTQNFSTPYQFYHSQ